MYINRSMNAQSSAYVVINNPSGKSKKQHSLRFNVEEAIGAPDQRTSNSFLPVLSKIKSLVLKCSLE